MSETNSKQTLIPRDDDEQWQNVLRGEVEMDSENSTHLEAKEVRQYLLSTEMQDAVESIPDSHTLTTLSPEEAQIKYHNARDEINRRAGKKHHWRNYGLILLFGIMAGLVAFFAAHYFSANNDIADTTPSLANGKQVDAQNSSGKYKALKTENLGTTPNLLPIPAGVLMMGCTDEWDGVAGGCRDNEYPPHEVTVQAFEMAQYEVTVGQFRYFIKDSGYKTIAEKEDGCVIANKKDVTPAWIMKDSANWQSPGFVQEDTHPVVCTARSDALAYIDWLNKKTNKQYRLPTEAEWEYAARAGTATPYAWGNQADHDRANFKGTKGFDIWENTSPVGSFRTNSFSLGDMSGNAWEWVSDCWHGNYASAPSDGSSWNTNCHRKNYVTRRGGAWDAPAISIRSSYRSRAGEIDRSQGYGFRIAHDMKPEAEASQ